MISSCFARSMATQGRKSSSSLLGMSVGRAIVGNSSSNTAAAAAGLWNETNTNSNSNHNFASRVVRWKSSSSNNSGSKKKPFRPRRAPQKGGYYSRLDRSRASESLRRKPKPGPREPNDTKTALPRIDRSRVRIRDALDADDEDDLTSFGPLMGGALRALRHEAAGTNPLGGGPNDYDSNKLESRLRMMDFFTSVDGSTEDLVGARRAVAADTHGGSAEADAMLRRIDDLVDEERFEYMELPRTDDFNGNGNGNSNGESNSSGGADDNSGMIPRNQLAHGDWGEMLIRTDRVSKMWRGGRVVSFRALVIGGNLRGCAGFGVGKAFEPEDAVEIACRMAKRNIFFVDRYRGRTLSRDLVGRQNSCKVVLRTTTNGLRGNPLCCEILKLLGVTNVVAKAHGSRNHYNVVRATFKALLTHESLDEVALKRGLRLVNLQRAKRLGI